MTLPNWVPQSPMWLSVITSWPRTRAIRARQSPRIVLRMWPTCIGLATFGELKSMMIRSLSLATLTPNLLSRKIAATPRARNLVVSRKLINPAPATSGGSQISWTSRLRKICSARLLRSGLVFFGQDHRHVALIVAKPGIGGGNHLGRHPWVGFLQSQFEPFGEDLARSRHQLRGDRLSKTRRICAASCALLSSSRTALSFRNFAMAASVRR